MAYFHHVVAVPTHDPVALSRFLSWHSDYVRELGLDVAGFDYAVIGGGDRRVNRQLARLVAGFRKSDRVIGSRVHFFGDGWKLRLARRLEKAGVSRAVTSFLSKQTIPALRNLGHLAAHAIAAGQKRDVDRVLLHQADHDVLPAYVLSREPETLRLLPFSWFDSAERIFRRHPEAAVLCGRYLGDPDKGILSMLTSRELKLNPPLGSTLSSRVDAVLENPGRARRVAEALAAGIDLDNVHAWVHLPHRDDVASAYSVPLPSPHGGVLSFRLGRFGHAPPTPYRGDDMFHVRSLLGQDAKSVFVSPHRAAFHEKNPRGRHLVNEMKSDFMDALLGQLVERRARVGDAPDSGRALAEVVRDSARKTLNWLPSDDVVRGERAAVRAALKTSVSGRARQDLELAKKSYGVFLTRLRQARAYFDRVAQNPGKVVKRLHRDAAAFELLNRNLAGESSKMTAVAAQMGL